MSQPKNFQNGILILVPVKSLHFNSNNKHSGRSRNSPVTEPSYRDKLRIITSEPSINIKPTYSAISFVLGNKKIDFFSSTFYSITWLLFNLQGLFVRCQSVFLRQFVKAGRANHCVKSGRSNWEFFGPYFLLFGLNAETYRVNLQIHCKYGKVRIRRKVYLDNFHTVNVLLRRSHFLPFPRLIFVHSFEFYFHSGFSLSRGLRVLCRYFTLRTFTSSHWKFIFFKTSCESFTSKLHCESVLCTPASEVYFEPRQISNMECFCRIVNGLIR